MKKLIVLSAALLMYYFSISQNVGIGNSSPQGKLHIKGSADTSQLVIDAGITHVLRNRKIIH